MAKENERLINAALIRLINDGEPKIRATLKAAKIAATVVTLALAASEMDHWPTQAEYADWYDISERKAQEEWALFRRAFGKDADINDFAGFVQKHMQKRLAEKTAHLIAPAPDWLELQPA